MLQNESVEKNKSIQSLHNQICSFEIEIERQKEMLRNNESKILHLQVSGLGGQPPSCGPRLLGTWGGQGEPQGLRKGSWLTLFWVPQIPAGAAPWAWVSI